MRALLLLAIALPLAAAALPALAQTDPSTRQLIESLKLGTLRGIKTVKPGMAVAPPEPPSATLSVAFATDSAELTPRARETLDRLGHALASADLAQDRFRIEGHTDTVGSADYNKALSQRRADAAAAYLEQNFGVAAARLEAVGLGEDGLLVATPPQTPNAQNRRVKVVNLGG